MKTFLITILAFLLTVSIVSAAYTVTGTLSTDGSIPKAPTSVIATKSGDTAITVTWTAVVGVEGYKVYQKKDSGSFELITGNVTALSYVNSGLSNGVYSYQVQSFLGSLAPDLNSIVPTSPITIVIPTPTPTPSGGGGGLPPASTPTPSQTLTPLSTEAEKVDVFNDNKIDVLDFNVLMANWGNAGTGDVNNDGTVDILDFNMLMAYWS